MADHFAFPPAWLESACCFTYSPAFGVSSVLDFGYSNRHVVESHCSFNLHFPNYIWCGTSFHSFFCSPHIFFGALKLSVPFFLLLSRFKPYHLGYCESFKTDFISWSPKPFSSPVRLLIRPCLNSNINLLEKNFNNTSD